MANHVYFNMEISLDAGQAEIVEKLRKSCEEKQGEMEWTSFEVQNLPIYDTAYNEEDWYSWGCENIGAKWISVEHWDEYSISGHSAWSPVIPFMEKLVSHIAEQSGKPCNAQMTYEDEFRNFVGIHECWVDRGVLECDNVEYEGDDFNQLMLEAFGKTEEWFQSDDFDWWEVYPITQEGHRYNGEEWEPQQYVDELVYQLFETKELNHLK